MLPSPTRIDAERKAEVLRGKLEQSPCEWQGKRLPLRVGVGCAAWSADTTPQDTVARVDSAC